jgi:thiamine biosynthesis lipoprotein
MQKFKTSFFAFDTLNALTIYHTDAAPLDAAKRLCRQFEQWFSRFIPGSDIWRLNHADGAPIRVSRHTARLLALCAEYSAKTDGVFDISVGAVTQCWDFSRGGGRPSRQDLEQSCAAIGYAGITLQEDLVALRPGMALDLGGAAKGYIADELAGLFRSMNVVSAMINLGGNVYALGFRADESPWRVGVRKPGKNADEIACAMQITDRSVVTSGIYERGYFDRNEYLHHILDVKTGAPIRNDLVSVTLVTPTSTAGDILTTACFCLGIDAGLALTAREAVDGILFIRKDGSMLWRGESGILIDS